MTQAKVVLTDHPWPDLSVERAIFAAANVELISGPIEAQSVEVIDALIAQHKAQAIMCCWASVSERAIRSCPELRIVARLGVGLDNIDVATATACGAWVTNVPDYCVEEVSDHAIAMCLSHWRGINAFDREAKLGRWNPASANLKRARNMTVGVIGYGRIGQATARKLTQGFGATVLAYSPSLLKLHREGDELLPKVCAASLANIQLRADAIVLHLPLTPMSRYLINDVFLGALRRKPILINVSRGGLIDNEALMRALDAGAISGAALDVIEGEPVPLMALMSRRDVIVTPHIAFSSDASLAELRRRCSEEVVRVLRGEAPLYPCNSPRV